jgi:predicted MFS family arabinose efflux permease
LGAVSLAAALALPRGFGASPPTAAGARVAKAPWPPETLELVACYGAFGFGYIIPATFLAAMARDALRDPAVYGWSWPVFGAAAAASTFIAAALARRLAGRRLWAASHVAMAAGVLAPLLLGGMPGIILGALLVGGTFMVATMAGMQEARRIAPSQAPRVIGAMTASFAAGQIAGPLVVSALAARGMGYGPALWGAAAVLAATAFLLLRPATSERLP